MQTINHWPDITELAALPDIVAQDVYKQLLEPFENESMAGAFWEETNTNLIILEPGDCIQELSGYEQIKFALDYPEYSIKLSMGYQLFLAIKNDSGSGIYLITPPELNSALGGILCE